MTRDFPRSTSRREQMEALQPGQSAIFPVPAGQTLQRLQATLASIMTRMGTPSAYFEQAKALLIIGDSEKPVICTVVTRKAR